MNDKVLWEEVLESLGYPNLRQPSYSLKIPTALINLETTNILINPDFVKEIKAPLPIALKGVMAHEANHHVTAPYDLKTNLIIDQNAGEVSKENANKISNYFLDVVINLDLAHRGLNEISSVYKGMDLDSEIDKTLRAFYNYKTNLDFGFVNPSDLDMDVLKKLVGLSYDPSLEVMKEEVKIFGNAINHLLSEESNGLIDEINMDDYPVSSKSSAAIDAVEYLNPESFKKYGGLKDYYDLLAKKNSFYIKKDEGSVQKEYYSEWDVGDDYHGIDIYKSKNKFLPGLTIKKDSFSIKKQGTFNDALIILDSSGSMPSPDYGSPAITASFCIANHYLGNNKKLGVVNFSTVQKNHLLSDNPDKIKKDLLEYQGGLSNLDINSVFKDYQKKFPLDIYLITDMLIEESKYIYQKLSKSNCKVSIFDIGNNEAEIFGLKKYVVDDIQKLPGIVVGDLNGI